MAHACMAMDVSRPTVVPVPSQIPQPQPPKRKAPWHGLAAVLRRGLAAPTDVEAARSVDLLANTRVAAVLSDKALATAVRARGSPPSSPVTPPSKQTQPERRPSAQFDAKWTAVECVAGISETDQLLEEWAEYALWETSIQARCADFEHAYEEESYIASLF